MSGRSIAVWTGGSVNEGQSHEVHVNYWRMSGAGNPRLLKQIINRNSRDFCDLLELGIWIKKPENIDHIKIYLPFSISRKNLSDCSEHFRTPDISQAIFNEPVNITQGQKGSAVIIAKKGEEFYTGIFSFEPDNDGLISESELKIENKGKGTQITINKKAIKTAEDHAPSLERLYFRIRISLEGSSPFVSTIQPYDGALQSGYEEIDYIDFRLNETRTLPRDVQTDLLSCSSRLVKLSFLTAAPISLGLSGNDSPLHKVRVLESDMWSRYVKDLPPHMMVYHWTRKADEGGSIADFSGFAKFAMRRSGRLRVFKYLIVFIILSVISSLLAAQLDGMFASQSAHVVNEKIATSGR